VRTLGKGEIERGGGLYEIFLYENCSLETNSSNSVMIRTQLVNGKKGKKYVKNVKTMT